MAESAEKLADSISTRAVDDALLRQPGYLGFSAAVQQREAAREASFRKELVGSGAADEIMRSFVGLLEAPHLAGQPPDSSAALEFVQQHFGKSKLAPVVKGRPFTHADDVVAENEALKKRVSDLRGELKAIRDELKAVLPQGTLSISSIAAFGVPDSDAVGAISDPYVQVSLLDVPGDDDEEISAGRDMRSPIAARTTHVMNATNPVWEGEVLELLLPAGTPRPPRVLVRVWDKDFTQASEPLASTEMQLESGGGAVNHHVLAGRGGLPDIEVSFTYSYAT